MLLADKSVVITGAGSGVGRATALLFADNGANVLCADVDDAANAETAALIEKSGGTAIPRHCDVRLEADVAAAVADAADHFGQLDVMFNNAGVPTPSQGCTFEEHTDADWDRLMSINLRGAFYGCKHAVIQLKSQGGGGVILNTASIAGMVGFGGAVYGATKAGVISLTRTLAIEAAPFNIRVNAICPTSIDTPFMSFDTAPAGVREMVADAHPLRGILDPRDIAEAALYLASDGAKHVTGISLPVDLGYIAR